MKIRVSLALGAMLVGLAACGGGESNNARVVRNDEYGNDAGNNRSGNRPGLGPNAGLVVFGVDRSRAGGGAGDSGGGTGLSVNAYLWRATLDTLSFMPLASADPFGGVVITDWYSPASAPDERFKATAYVLGRQLRSDGVRLAVFKQVRAANGGWVDASVAPSTASDLEDRVLARARELRSQSAAN